MGIVLFDLYNSIFLNHQNARRKLGFFHKIRAFLLVLAVLPRNCLLVIEFPATLTIRIIQSTFHENLKKSCVKINVE